LVITATLLALLTLIFGTGFRPGRLRAFGRALECGFIRQVGLNLVIIAAWGIVGYLLALKMFRWLD
jgi:hypothetical protein